MKLFKLNTSLSVKDVSFRLATSFLFCFPLMHHVFAANDETRIKSNISTVTVYPAQAQVTRVAQLNLQKGITHFVFNDVSPFINMNSIQVKTDNNVNLVAVSQRSSTENNPIKPAYILDIEDSLQRVADNLSLLKNKREALLTEKEVMLANKVAGGTSAILHADDLEETMALFRKRIQEIGDEVYKIGKNEKPLLELQQQLKAILDDYINRHANQVELLITLQAEEATTSNLEFTYLVGNCTWNASYDIRIKDMHSPMQLISKAAITQNTGEDWTNAKLRLSTSNPNENGTKPELNPNHINFIEANYGLKLMKSPRVASAPASAEALNYQADNAVAEQMDTHIEFNVVLPYTIPSDNNAHLVDLTTTNIPAVYAYGTVPKLDPSVFATALIPANDLANQLAGNANIYFNGTYTGQTYLQGTTEDSLLISLGKDSRILIERTLQKELSNKSCFGSTKTDTKNWNIAIRNTRKEAITLIVEDQIPVSDNAEIIVKLLDAKGADFDETTGKLTWKLTLEPEKSTTLNFSFEVKYPKNKAINAY